MILEKFSLAGRRGIVTGAGQGLGRVFALAFAEAGADVAVAEINRESGPETAAEIERLGRRSLYVETDVRSPESVERMVQAVAEELGGVDFIMNNAGITKWRKAEEVPEAEWREVMDVNLSGVFYCCQAAARRMIEQRSGCIINMASMSGLIVNRPQAQASYNTSKAAVIHLTRSLAGEWAPYGIRVNAIAPGYMATPMAEPFFADSRYGEVWFDSTPMHRPGQPEELGPLAVFLASEASSFMTGAVVVVDGGYSVW
jgi:NAD(P)-dependent dehydrogenase (short-subunit alcohol dehydrogenase family)